VVALRGAAGLAVTGHAVARIFKKSGRLRGLPARRAAG
jgi:hypothetical protein